MHLIISQILPFEKTHSPDSLLISHLLSTPNFPPDLSYLHLPTFIKCEGHWWLYRQPVSFNCSQSISSHIVIQTEYSFRAGPQLPCLHARIRMFYFENISCMPSLKTVKILQRQESCHSRLQASSGCDQVRFSKHLMANDFPMYPGRHS